MEKNIENNLLKIINENQKEIDESVLDFISDFTKNKVETFFNNDTVQKVLAKLISKIVINNPEILKAITTNVLENIKINVEKK
jgi:hypothetical protein